MRQRIQSRPGEVAQLVEHTTENRGVVGSIPTLAIEDSIAPKVSDQALEMRKEKYALAVGVTVANMWVQEEKLGKAHTRWEEEKNGEEPERPMSEAQIQRALVEDARGVIVLLPEFDTAIGDVGQAEDEPAPEASIPAAG